MKKISILVVVAAIITGIFATSCNSSKTKPKLRKGLDSASYAIGMINGAGFKKSIDNLPGDPIDIDLLLAGLEAVLKSDTAAYMINPEKAQAYLQQFFAAEQEREDRENKEKGEKFLEENKTQSGVITTESGLQYRVEKEGTGTMPTEKDQVKVHYVGSLLDGTIFDSSIERGTPSTFRVTQVIKGWQEGLQIMPTGSKYTFWIPADLAYGVKGSRNIKPNSVLKFNVELLEIIE